MNIIHPAVNTQTELEFAHYAEGVFLAVTGATVAPFKPQYAGFVAGCNGMAQLIKRMYYDYCVNTLGYVDPLPRWSDNPLHYAQEVSNG
jgi:hypothetical protein